MPRLRWSPRAGAGAALAVFLAASAWLTHRAHRLEESLKETTEESVSALRGQPAPNFTLPVITPQPDSPPRTEVALGEARGKIVFVSFWASWCRPCDYELPLLNQFYVNHRQEGVEVIAISVDSEQEAAQQYAESRRFALPMVWDGTGQVADAYKVESLPTLVVIDRTGRIRQVERGLRMDLEAWLQMQVRALSPRQGRAQKD